MESTGLARNSLYDSGRGIGIILLFAGHLFAYSSISFAIIFSFHMPLFFIISGMLFNPDKYDNFRVALYGLGKNFIYPYLFYNLLAIIVLLIRVFMFDAEMPSIKNMLIETFYLWQPNYAMLGATWFLSCLFLVQLFTWCILRYIKMNLRNCICILVLLFCCTVLFKILNQLFKLPMNIYNAVPATIFFYSAYLLRDKILKLVQKKWNPAILIFAIVGNLVLVVENRTVNMAIPVYNNYFFYFFSSFLGSFLVLYVAKYNFFKMFQFYGRNSLAIFSLHGFWLFTFAGILSYYTGHQYYIMQNIPFGYCILGVIFVSVLSIPSYYIIEPIYIYTKKKFFRK